MIVLSTGVEDLQAAPALVAWFFDQNFIANLGNVDRYQHRVGECRIWSWSWSVSPEWVVNIHILEKL